VQENRTYGDIFRNYLRLGTKPDRIQQIFSYGPEAIDLCGFRVARNPLGGLGNLLAQTTGGFNAFAIHGDLHLSNVVISEGRPRLVDFAFAGIEDHVMKDFALMESSIRFMRFPRHVHPKLMLSVDEALNRNWSVDAAREIVPQRAGGRGAMALNCMIDLVSIVRDAARTMLFEGEDPASSWSAEYYRTLYLILAGQQRFPTFPLVRSAINLSQLAEYT
jgi:hypothetical protein